MEIDHRKTIAERYKESDSKLFMLREEIEEKDNTIKSLRSQQRFTAELWGKVEAYENILFGIKNPDGTRDPNYNRCA